MLAGYQTKSVAQTAILTLFCAVCLFFSFLFFFSRPRLLFIDSFQVFSSFSFVHIGIGRTLTEWVYWAGVELLITIPPCFVVYFARFSYSFLDLTCSLLSLNLVFYLSLFYFFSLSFADDVLIWSSVCLGSAFILRTLLFFYLNGCFCMSGVV